MGLGLGLSWSVNVFSCSTELSESPSNSSELDSLYETLGFCRRVDRFARPVTSCSVLRLLLCCSYSRVSDWSRAARLVDRRCGRVVCRRAELLALSESLRMSSSLLGSLYDTGARLRFKVRGAIVTDVDDLGGLVLAEWEGRSTLRHLNCGRVWVID